MILLAVLLIAFGIVHIIPALPGVKSWLCCKTWAKPMARSMALATLLLLLGGVLGFPSRGTLYAL